LKIVNLGFSLQLQQKFQQLLFTKIIPIFLKKRPYRSENLVRLNCLFENDNLLICFMLIV